MGYRQVDHLAHGKGSEGDHSNLLSGQCLVRTSIHVVDEVYFSAVTDAGHVHVQPKGIVGTVVHGGHGGHWGRAVQHQLHGGRLAGGARPAGGIHIPVGKQVAGHGGGGGHWRKSFGEHRTAHRAFPDSDVPSSGHRELIVGRSQHRP